MQSHGSVHASRHLFSLPFPSIFSATKQKTNRKFTSVSTQIHTRSTNRWKRPVCPPRKCRKRHETAAQLTWPDPTPTPPHSYEIPSSLYPTSTSSATKPHQTLKSTSASTRIHARWMNQPNHTVRPHKKMHQSTKPHLSSAEPSTVTRPPKFPFPPYFLSYQTQQNQKNSPRIQKRRMERHETRRFAGTPPAKEQRRIG